MAKLFQTEREGQIKFFEDLKIATDVELTNNTDGVYRGTLFEFKLTIANIDKVLFQAIKYLSHLRIKGESVPKNILLVSLNTETAYLFDSQYFLSEIEQIYIGASSKDNDKFDTTIKPEKIEFSNINGLQRVLQILDTDNFTKIHIDVFCVIGWAERFYSEKPKATKINLFDELRQPKHFENLIFAWQGDEQDFKYIMDCLNDKMHKKELGAFYTPPAYCKKATELVRQAIDQIPKGNDYIILDRCAGTGNLEEFLTDKNVDEITIGELEKYLSKDFIVKYLKDKANIISTYFSETDFNNVTLKELETYKTKINIYNYLFDNELSHCIVNTYELKEWLVLNERIGDKVKTIIPPISEIHNTHSVVKGGDALSENFILGRKTALFDMTDEYYNSIEELNNIVKNQNINIIMLENPPYRNDIAGNDKNNGEVKKMEERSFVFNEMVKVANTFSNSNISTVKDISNRFIWAGWNFYLQKENDFYILLSPIKYWKSLGISNKKFIKGFLFNRKYFHATESSISCILWKNEYENIEKIKLIAYDLFNENLVYVNDIEISKVYQTFEPYFDRRNFENDMEGAVYCENGGNQTDGRKCDGKSYWNENIIGYLVVKGFAISPQDVFLLRETRYNIRGFYIRSDNFLEKLPLFCAKLYPQKNWYERDVYFTTADGGDRYTKDNDFLKVCFIFTCLSQRNHCLSFNGSDGRFYKNELCFDAGTLATQTVETWNFTPQDTETELLSIFAETLKLAKETKNYNAKFAYGTYQIDKELNTRDKDDNGTIIYDYPELNTKLIAIKTKLSKYYEGIIQPKLFEYELLK
ncbi:MAG: hypothetical protein LBN74_00955 [Prevotella sp.]|jgi:hypothetical protein|nr:hypothetical protein [Prevotella sp.]